METIRHEFEKLYRALKASHEKEKKLWKECQRENEEIIGTATKIRLLIDSTKDDANAISILRADLENALKLLELSKEREEKNKQKMENQHSQIKSLQEQIAKRDSLTGGQTQTVHELLQQKDELTKGFPLPLWFSFPSREGNAREHDQ